MKNVLKRNIRTLLVVFCLMFTGLVVYLGYVVMMYGERWFITPYNPRLRNIQESVDPGDVLDRTGSKLIYMSKGSRIYVKDKSTRKAVAHVVGDSYGMTYGAQTMFAKYLFGFNKDTVTRIIDLISGSERRGSDVTLTIDAKLCKSAYEALGGNKGAIVVMNYKTGEILASVSSPAFDPADMEVFLKGGGESELVNRAFSGLYPPGSTFKIITSAALIEKGMAGFEATCTGSTEIGGKTIKCTGEHGKENLKDALRHSCNVYFAHASEVLGISAVNDMANRFLFNTELLFDDVIMGQSVFNTSANASDNAWAAIGQYHDLLSPLHACMIAGAIANDGVMMEPKLLLSVSDGGKQTVMLSSKVAAVPLRDTKMLKEMMIAAVENGTGSAAAIKNVAVGGKTGTAQIEDKNGKAEHAWFIGFIDDNKHPLCIAVLMERAGSGGKNAAPAARSVLRKAIELGY